MSKAKIKAIEKKHAKGYLICDTALSTAAELFKDIEDFQHCQTGQDGSIEVIIGDECVPNDYNPLEALEMLKAQS